MTRRPKFVARVEITRTANGEPSTSVEVESAPADAWEAQRLALALHDDLQQQLAPDIPAASKRLR